MGNLIWAVAQGGEVHVVLAEPSLKNVIHHVHDVCGSLKYSFTTDDIEFLSLLDPENEFFNCISELPHREQCNILSQLSTCETTCGECSYCAYCKIVADEYSVYDLFEYMEKKNDVFHK